MLNFWESLGTEWKTRFGEHSTRVGDSLVFEISKSQKEYMEKLGDLQYELHFPTSVTYTLKEDGCYECIVMYDDLDSWYCNWEKLDEELTDYLNELR